jgi:hypothetical protein
MGPTILSPTLTTTIFAGILGGMAALGCGEAFTSGAGGAPIGGMGGTVITGGGGVGGSGGISGFGGFAGSGGSGGSGPVAPIPYFYKDVPCDAKSISYEAAKDSLFVTCGADSTPANALFRNKPFLGANGTWKDVAQVSGTPTNHIHLGDIYYLVVRSDPAGFDIFEVDDATGDGTLTQSVDFSAISPLDPTYDFIKSTINNPLGAVLVGGWIGIATANQDQLPPNPTYYAGSVIFFQNNFDGTVYIPATKAMLTSGINPTGVTLLGNGDIAVVNSNTSTDNPPTTAELDVCTVPSGPCTPITLGNVYAQTIPTIEQIDSGAILLVGVQKPDPNKGFIGVDWANGVVSITEGNVDVIDSVSSLTSFDTGVDVLALIGSAGIYDDPANKGALLLYNMDQNGWTGTLKTEYPGKSGPAVVVGDKHYATVTVNDGGNPAGQIYRTDLSGL